MTEQQQTGNSLMVESLPVQLLRGESITRAADGSAFAVVCVSGRRAVASTVHMPSLGTELRRRAWSEDEFRDMLDEQAATVAVYDLPANGRTIRLRAMRVIESASNDNRCPR